MAVSSNMNCKSFRSGIKNWVLTSTDSHLSGLETLPEPISKPELLVLAGCTYFGMETTLDVGLGQMVSM